MTAVSLMSRPEYAKHRGCSAVAVHKAIKAGRISLIDGKIDAAVADIQWAKNTRARIGSRAPAAAEPGRQQTDADGISYEEARRRREAAEAERAELLLAELRADLMRTDAVHSMVAKLAAGLREGLLQIPPRLAPVLAAEADAAVIQETLAAALRGVLEQVTTPGTSSQ